MCGIAGLVRWGGLRPDEAGVGARMADTLRHRGPDDAGLHEDAWASLGHTRLSIIDLAGGHQPLSNEDGSIWVVFNGEIYNHRELRGQLAARGHRVRTDSDTETIVHLYEDHGPDFVHRLNGMFAIALWDTREKLLLLVRDRLGVKPLYWHDDGRRIVFGSELKALRAAADAPDRIDPCAMVDYLTFGHVRAPRTIYSGVRKLEPGHLALCRASGVWVRKYWDIPPAISHRPTFGEHEWIERLARCLEDAVALRMIADVSLGAFLSGGLDSAAVVAAMTRSPARSDIATHTAGFCEQEFDEREEARQTARLLGTDHREILVGVDAADTMHHLARHFDEPFADASAVPTYHVSRSAREHLKVALAGDGADELLGGYRRYAFHVTEDRWRQQLPRLVRQFAGIAGRAYPRADWLPRGLRARVTLQNIACDPILAHLRSTALHWGVLPDALLRAESATAVSHYCPFEQPQRLALAYESDHLLGRLLYLDAKTLLADDMLTKVDRASMAVGLEVREPMLDYRLVELAPQLPVRLRLRKAGLRSVLRHWSLGSLADKSKKGFEVPLDRWFRSSKDAGVSSGSTNSSLRPLARDLLCSRSARIAEWVEPRAIQRLIAQHERGWRNHGAILWAMLTLELWAREHLGLGHRAARSGTSGRAGGGHGLESQTVSPIEPKAIATGRGAA